MALTMGTSTREDMLRVFGESEDFAETEKWRNETPNLPSEIDYVYENVGEIRGLHRVAVSSRDGKIVWILIEPEKMLKSDIVRLYGPNYVITKYDTDDCIDDEDGVPLFESPNGRIKQFEYRERGIFFRLKKQDSRKSGDLVELIMFVSEPPGATTSRCNLQR
jgi:hypothetical protein